MMNPVQNTGATNALQKIYSNPIRKQLPTDGSTPMKATDRLELSGASHLLAALKANSGVRADKVADIKGQIAAGTYDADGSKLDSATDKLLDELNK